MVFINIIKLACYMFSLNCSNLMWFCLYLFIHSFVCLFIYFKSLCPMHYPRNRLWDPEFLEGLSVPLKMLIAVHIRQMVITNNRLI